MAFAKRIHHFEYERGEHGAKERTPQRLERKIVADLFETEEHAADGRTERDRHASRRGCREYLAFACLVAAVLGKQVGEDVAATAGHVHERALFAEHQTGARGQYHAQRFDKQRPFAQIAAYYEPAQDSFDLDDSKSLC